MSRSPVRIVAALLAACLVAACSPSDDPAPVVAPPGAGTVGPGIAPLPTDLQDLVDDAGEQLRRLTVTCMETKGFHVHRAPPEHIVIPPLFKEEFVPRLTKEQAAAHGYGLGDSITGPAVEPAEPESDRQPDAFHQQPDDYVARYDAAWGKRKDVRLPDGQAMGFFTGGCYETAARLMFGDIDAYLELKATKASEPQTVSHKTSNDKRVRDAWRAWSTCMAAAGYEGLADSDAAYEHAQRYYGPRGGGVPKYNAVAHKKELAQAVADADCAARTKVDEIYHQVQLEKLNEFRTTHETDNVAYHDLLRSAITKAQQLLQQGSGQSG